MKFPIILVLFVLGAEAYNKVSKRSTLLEHSKMLMSPKTCVDISPLLTGFACPIANLCSDPTTLPGQCGSSPTAYQCTCNVNSGMQYLYELTATGTPGTEIDVLCPGGTNLNMFTCESCKCPTMPILPLNGFTCTRRNPTTSEKSKCPPSSTATDVYVCCQTPCPNALIKCVLSSPVNIFNPEKKTESIRTTGKLCYTKICCS